MARCFGELHVYIQGWIYNFGLSEYYRPLPLLEERRRFILMSYLKQWRKPRTRIRNLIALGVGRKLAIDIGFSSKGPYRLAKTYATQLALNNPLLQDQGLVSIREAWIKFNYP